MSHINKARKDQRKFFGIADKPEYILHHADLGLKKRDYDRYREWRPEDLIVLTQTEHKKLHAKNLSEETRKKMSDSHRGKKRPPITEETREKMRISHLGKNNRLGYKHSEETKQKIRDKKTGSKYSEEARQNMRQSQIKRWSKKREDTI